MSTTFHTIGIVLRVTPAGEDDRRASIYTQDHGKLEVFVKSARRIKSKLSPHLEPLTLVDCFVARGRMDHLAGIERLDRFSGLRASLEQLTAGLWAAEAVDMLTKPDHDDHRIFPLLTSWFSFLESLSVTLVPQRARLVFLFSFFSTLGYRLECNHCVRCNSERTSEWMVSALDGGLICHICRPTAAPGGVIISEPIRATLAALDGSWQPNFSLDAYRAVPSGLARILIERMLTAHLDRPLATDRFLMHVSAEYLA